MQTLRITSTRIGCAEPHFVMHNVEGPVALAKHIGISYTDFMATHGGQVHYTQLCLGLPENSYKEYALIVINDQIFVDRNCEISVYNPDDPVVSKMTVN